MSSSFGTAIEALSRIRGVTGAMVVGESDGLVVDAVLQDSANGDVVAALAASLYRRARLSAAAAGLGPISFFQLDAEEGRICAIGSGDIVLVVIAGGKANLGLIRMALIREMELLA